MTDNEAVDVSQLKVVGISDYPHAQNVYYESLSEKDCGEHPVVKQWAKSSITTNGEKCTVIWCEICGSKAVAVLHMKEEK